MFLMDYLVKQILLRILMSEFTFCNLGIISDIPLGLGAGTLNTSIV